jgi:hypothetical protein
MRGARYVRLIPWTFQSGSEQQRIASDGPRTQELSELKSKQETFKERDLEGRRKEVERSYILYWV